MVQKLIQFDQLPDGHLFRFEGALYRKMGQTMGVLILRAMRQKPTDDQILEFSIEQPVTALTGTSESPPIDLTAGVA